LTLPDQLVCEALLFAILSSSVWAAADILEQASTGATLPGAPSTPILLANINRRKEGRTPPDLPSRGTATVRKPAAA